LPLAAGFGAAAAGAVGAGDLAAVAGLASTTLDGYGAVGGAGCAFFG